MSIRKVFIDWNRPALPSAVEYLCQRYTSKEVLDLQQTIVVLPSARAGRRLLEILVDQAEVRQVGLAPPPIVTAGQLPELLYEAERPFASRLTQHFAWVEALRKADPQALARLSRHVPADDDPLAWLALGETLPTLHHELAGEGLVFADVAVRAQTVASFDETERWQALAAIQSRYFEAVDSRGVWDQQTARLWAIHHEACHTLRDVVLVGEVDLNLNP